MGPEQNKEVKIIKPCELNSGESDYNCITCPYFNECQMANISELKEFSQLDDDY